MRRTPRSPVLLLLVLSVLAHLPADIAGFSTMPTAAAQSASPDVNRRVLPYPVMPPANLLEAIAQGTRTAEGLPGPNYWQQEASYSLTARLFPEDKRVEGTARITYTNNAPDTLRRLHLELAQNLHQEGALRLVPAEVTGGMQVSHLAVDGQSFEAGTGGAGTYFVQGTQLVLFLPSPLAPGASTELEAEWAFTVPKAGANGRMGYDADNLFFIAYWYPILSVYDDVEGWNTDPFLGIAEFYHGFGTYDLTVEAPAGWLVMASGALQNPEAVLAPEALERMRRAHASDTAMVIVGPADFDTATLQGTAGRLRWHFTAQQVRDVAFSATRASIWEAARTPVGDPDGDGEPNYTHINTFYRESAPRWRHVTRYQQHAISFLSAYTGLAYPWPHMTAVEGSGIIGGGMEFPMMTLMGDYNAAGDAALYNVTAHELAHMWIPMIASPNERRYSWIDEGSTSFAENQARQDFFPGENHALGDQNTYVQFARAGLEGEMVRRSNYHYSGGAFSIASYAKPATVLRALRGVLGEETFNRAYQAFIETWAFKHPYPYDLFNTFERISGRDLDWFWRSWYYETWILDHAVVEVRPGPDGTDIVIEDRGQVPMPVHLTVTLENGETRTLQQPVDVWLTGATRTILTVHEDTPVTRVEIDPERNFPDVDRSDNVWVPPSTAAPSGG